MPLTFDELRSQNVPRSEETFLHKLHDWTPAEWSNAVAGECGEMCNLTKKLRRGDFTEDELRWKIANELADIVIYADLLAACLSINLGQAVAAKFNQVSLERGSDRKLPVT